MGIVHAERTHARDGTLPRRRPQLRPLVGTQGMVRLLLQLQHIVQALDLGVEVLRVRLQALLLLLLLLRSGAQQLVGRLRGRRRVDGRVVGVLGARRGRILRRHDARAIAGVLRADDFPGSDSSAVAQWSAEARAREMRPAARARPLWRVAGCRSWVTRAGGPLQNTKKTRPRGRRRTRGAAADNRRAQGSRGHRPGCRLPGRSW
jgi:hypothetical protein